MSQPINEKDDRATIDSWYEEAKTIAPATLAEFVRHLTTDYAHDYGSICHAAAAAAVAAAWAVDKSPQGGISGFQAGAIMWEFMRAWNGVKFPSRLVRYENMLYPQYEDEFDKVLDPETWKYLQKQARTNLAERGGASGRVAEHWQSIAAGIVPFGYRVKQ